MAGQDFPTHPSNRNIISRMKMWGWEEQGTKKDWLKMKYIDGQTVEVRPATVHDGNLSSTFVDIYRITTGGDASKFWNTSSGDVKQMVAKKVAECSLKVTKPQPAPTEPGRKNGFPETIKPRPAPAPAAEPATQEQEEDMGTKEPKTDRKRGQSTEALEHLIAAHGEAMTTKQLGDLMGVSSEQAGKAAGYLHNLGLARRIKMGMYQVDPKMLAVNARVSVEHTPLNILAEQVKNEATAEAAERWVQVPRPPESQVTDEQFTVVDGPAKPITDKYAIDDELDDVLDLLFPQGFKAEHFRRIQAWRELTADLIGKVRS